MNGEKNLGRRGHVLLENIGVEGEFRCITISEREGRKLHKSELYNMYSSSNVIRMMKLWMIRKAQRLAPIEETGYVYKTLIVKPEKKISNET
jgi:hypothetical protein